MCIPYESALINLVCVHLSQSARVCFLIRPFVLFKIFCLFAVIYVHASSFKVSVNCTQVFGMYKLLNNSLHTPFSVLILISFSITMNIAHSNLFFIFLLLTVASCKRTIFLNRTKLINNTNNF